MRGKVFYNDRKSSILGDLEVIGVTSSSLLIPENLLIIYQKLEIKKNRREILAYLLRKYKFFLGNWQFRSSRKIKTLFQDSGLDLKRISFKPRNSDWLELGTIAMGFGVSRTYLFSYLLELEDRGLGDFFDIPQIRNVVTYFSNYNFSTKWISLPQIHEFQRIIYYKRE